MNKPKMYLEHFNITVNDLQESVRFFQTAFPHFKIRGGSHDNREWVHLGDEDTYIAINQAVQEDPKKVKNYDRTGINHLGFVVPDVAEVAKNLQENGYVRSSDKQEESFRIRDYFYDQDGNEFEFIQYLSDVAEERNSYEN